MEGTAIKDTYKSLSAPSEGIYKDKGSKFLSFAFPVETEQQIKEILEQKTKEFFDARHHCYAYRLGIEGETFRFNDDGEPSSTAGRPIYGQILSHELSDILIIVVRYFGGTKLGVPGLIKAYKEAAADAIAAGEIVQKIATSHCTVNFAYAAMDKVMRVLKDMSLTPCAFNSAMECEVEVDVRLSEVENFIERMEKAEASVTIDTTDQATNNIKQHN